MLKKILIAWTAVLTLGCFDNSEDADLAPPLSLATYNAGLARGFVPHADERLPAVAKAIGELDADVLCVQEVWEPDQIEAILEGTKSAFPHVYYDKPANEDRDGEAEPPCTEEEAATLAACVYANCADVPVNEMTGCVLGKCGDEFSSLSATCRSCVAAQVGKPTDVVLETCTGLSAGDYVYDGHNGLLLLSRRPLASERVFKLESHVTARAALVARVDDPGIGPLDIYCTHLTANLSGLEYAGEFESWEDERRAQITAILDDVESREDPAPAVLMGDMNCGPEVQGLGAEFPENFKLFEDAGFEAPFAEKSGTCSWCHENPLISQGDDGDNGDDTIIDQILIEKDAEIEVVETGRLFDGPVQITVDGEEITTRLSDHYGVYVDIIAP